MRDEKAVAREFAESLAGRDLVRLDQVLDESVEFWINGDLPMSGMQTKRSYVSLIAGLWERTIAVAMNIETVIAEGHQVAMTAKAQITPRTGDPYVNQYCFVLSIQEGRIRAAQEYIDTQAVARRLAARSQVFEECQRLTALEEIRTLKARYFRAVDQKDETLLRALFAVGAVADYRGAVADPTTGVSLLPSTDAQALHGVADIVKGIMAAVTGLVTVHHSSDGEIEFSSDREASGIWPIVDRLKLPLGGDIREIIGYGYYHETYVKESDRWKIKTLRMSRLRVDFVRA